MKPKLQYVEHNHTVSSIIQNPYCPDHMLGCHRSRGRLDHVRVLWIRGKTRQPSEK